MNERVEEVLLSGKYFCICVANTVVLYWLMNKVVLAETGNPNRDRVGGAKETPCSLQRRKITEHYL